MKRWALSRTEYLSFFLLALFILTALLAPFLANDVPIICKGSNGWSFPVWEEKNYGDCDWRIQPPIQYRFDNIDEQNAGFKSPFTQQKLNPGQQRHWLGTDQLGRDVAAGMIHGCRVALVTGTLSMLLALVIGLILGLFSGYYGNKGLYIRTTDGLSLLVIFFTISYFIFYADFFRNSSSALLMLSGLMLLVLGIIHFLLGRVRWFSKKRTLPLDRIQSVFIEIFQSMPGSFIILILVSLFTRASLYNVILVIGLLRWPMIARYVRAEMLKIKAKRFIEASKALGMTDLRIILRHALPATLTPVIVAVAFGFASAILLESALSFLGIGLPADHVSFGSMLSEARKNYEAWWMALFPGLAIFFLVFIFNHLGDRLSRLLDKK